MPIPRRPSPARSPLLPAPFPALDEPAVGPELLAVGQRVHLADTLSSLLGPLSLRAFVAPEATFQAPWAVEFPAGPLGCHVVTEGRVRLEMAGAEPVELGTGDFVLLPHGERHVLAAGTRVPAVPIFDLVGAPQFVSRSPIVHGGGGAVARVVTGCFVHADRSAERLFAALSPLVVVRDPGDGWLQALLRLVALETSHEAPAVHDLLHHLGRALLCRMLRRHLEQTPAAVGSLLERAGRRSVQAAVAAVHLHPEQPWTLVSLAKLAGMSRSTFAVQFREVMGVPPARYLYERRMEVGATLLPGDVPIKEIAARCGYATEAAFTNAFRRWAGVPPGAFRTRGQHADGQVRPADRS